MRDSLVARNYAEALIAAAVKEQAVERFGALLDVIAGVAKADPTVHAVLMSPRVPKAGKQRMVAQALKGVAPAPFVRFLQAVIQRGRQGLLGAMSEAYQDLADRHFNRAHASIVTAHAVDEQLGRTITERLTAVVGKTVVPPNEPNFASNEWAPKPWDFDRWYREPEDNKGVAYRQTP